MRQYSGLRQIKSSRAYAPRFLISGLNLLLVTHANPVAAKLGADYAPARFARMSRVHPPTDTVNLQALPDGGQIPAW